MVRNSKLGYGVITIFFHWTMALLVIAMLALGIYMHRQPLTDPNTFQLFQIHKSIGFVVLALAAMRLIWRLINPTPKLPDGMHPIERLAAHLGHIGLYVLLFAIPLSGWLMVSASPWGIPTVVFDVLPVPHLPVPEILGTKEAAESYFKMLHKYAAYFLIFLVVVHIAAAFKHHLIAKDDTLRRMLSPKTSNL